VRKGWQHVKVPLVSIRLATWMIHLITTSRSGTVAPSRFHRINTGPSGGEQNLVNQGRMLLRIPRQLPRLLSDMVHQTHGDHAHGVLADWAAPRKPAGGMPLK